MTDLAIVVDEEGPDLALEAGDLQLEEGLDSAVLWSLFSDQRARERDARALAAREQPSALAHRGLDTARHVGHDVPDARVAQRCLVRLLESPRETHRMAQRALEKARDIGSAAHHHAFWGERQC